MNKMQDNTIHSNRGELVIPQEEKELALFRSMYYQMNAKPDSMSKVYSQKVIIAREDIIDLNKRVNKKICMHYQDDGYIATVTVSLNNREVINFECWDEFTSYEWSESNCINSVILKWNFNIRMPQYEYPQAHVLMVKLSNGLRPEEMLNLIFSGKMEDFEEIETNTFPVAARVDFIEPILGDELLNIVAEWVSGLKENVDKKNRLILLMRKYRKRVAQYFNYFAFIMCIFLNMSIFNRGVKSFSKSTIAEYSTNQFLTMFNLLAISGIVLFALFKFLENMAQKVYSSLTEYGQIFTFAITKGDQKRQEELKNRDEDNAKKIMLRFIFSLIFNVVCGIVATLLVSNI